jgi:ADP-ribose pyrophosphatase YjhB (NUDIX family)
MGLDNMITLGSGRSRFSVRTVAVILDRDERRVLVHRAVIDDFWALPGGRLEMGEASSDGIVREMREELGVEVEVERLLWVAEEFFEFLDLAWHGIAFYYLVRLPADCPIYDRDDWSGIEEFVEDIFVPEHLRAEVNRLELIFKWHDRDRLHDLNLYPRFLQDRLRSLPPATEHIIRRGE